MSGEKFFFPIADGTVKLCHQVEPRVKLHVLREESFTIPLKYIDETRATNKSLDEMLEKKWTIIGTLMEIENCQKCGQVSQDSPFEMKNHPMYIHSPGDIGKKTNDLQTRHCVARDLEIHVRCVETQRNGNVGHRKTEALQCQKIVWF